MERISQERKQELLNDWLVDGLIQEWHDLPEDDRTFTVEEVPESFLLVQVDAGIERFQGNYDIDDIATQFGNASAGLSDYKMLDLDISTFKTDANILADTYAWYRELTDTLPEGKETVTNHATTTAETN